MKNMSNNTAVEFDFSVVAGLSVGVEYTDKLREAVKVWNGQQVSTDLAKKYDRITVKSADGKIVALNKTRSAYANLPEAVVKLVDEFFAEKEKTDKDISRTNIHDLLKEINALLPEDQRIKLNKVIEHGLTDCLRSRKMSGLKYTRDIKTIEKIIVRTFWAVLNKKELSVVYKGL